MKRALGLVCFIIGVLLQFLRVLGDQFEAVGAAGIPVMVLGIFLFVNSFDWSGNRKKETRINITSDELKRWLEKEIAYSEREEAIIKAYRNQMLPCAAKDILKVFFNEEGTRRYVFYQDGDIVRYALEDLYLFDEDECVFSEEYAYWRGADGGSSIYADLDIALKEQKRYLEVFHEEPLEAFFEKK